MDLAPFDIRVNCVCPGAIYTSATERHIESDGADRDEFLKAAAEKSFLKRMGRPEKYIPDSVIERCCSVC